MAAQDSGTRSAADEVADMLIYAPIGLLITIGEQLPQLVSKGRARVESRVTVARAVGQFAVAMGSQKVKGVVNERVDAVRGKRDEPPAAPGRAHEPASTASGDGHEEGHEAEGPEADGPTAGAGEGVSAISCEHLAIPGYDSLAASQVVQRLGGLSPTELDEVREYELATRARRTILGRIGQLSSSNET